MSSPVSKFWSLTAVTAGLWLLAALPAWLVAGLAGLEGLAYALLLCLAPGVIAAWFVKAGDGPNGALAALLLGMGMRMASVLIGTLVLKQVRPDLGPGAFHVWLVVGYLVMLAVETRLLLADIAVTRRGSGLGQPTV